MRLAAPALLLAALPAQISNVLTVDAPSTVAKRNHVTTAELTVQLRQGFHVNSNTPADPYLIPLKFTWTDTANFQPLEVLFPKPHMEKYEFSEKPLSVFTGDFKVQAKFKVLPAAPLGQTVLGGKLRYQACNDKMCLPPRSVDVRIPLTVRN